MLAMHSCVLGLLLNLILSFLIGCHGFSGGPPWKMCSLKIPKHHGMQQQSSDSPYEITLSKTTYSLGENITVTVRGKTNADLFRGFVIGAHPVTGDTENVVGKFVQLPADSKGMSWYAEAQNDPNCVCHNGASNKKSITFIWQAPPRNYGNLKFVAAIVKNFNVFWANVTSSVLTSNSASAVPAFTASIQFSSSLASLPDMVKGCGSTYGCILYPRYCKGSGCEMVVMFSVTGGILDLKMAGRNSGYLSMAVSDDRKMGNDFTISCSAKQGNTWASLQNGFNPAYNNERHRVNNYSNVRLHYGKEKIYCSFQRPLDISITTVKVNKVNVGTYSQKKFDLRILRYVFLAIGALYQGTDVLYKHTEEPIITDDLVDFQSKNIYYASALSILVQLHVSCMLLAWMLFAGIGMIIAANFKEVIVKMAFGAKLWFQLHRGVMITTALLSLIGLILILSYGWRDRSIIHGAVGLSVLVLCALQVLMGVARPSPSHKLRVMFNWGHFFVGNGIHILAAVTFILAFLMPHLPSAMRSANLIVVICWICFQVAWLIVFRLIRAKFRKEPVADRDGQMQIEQSNDSEKLHKLLLVLLIFYVITMIILFAVCLSFVTIY